MCDDPTCKKNNVSSEWKQMNVATCEKTNLTPDPTDIAHMTMINQRAACLDLVGEKAFNELYALLKSKKVDDASITNLSQLVFQIIPYDKSAVIPMMHKLLDLESQLEGH